MNGSHPGKNRRVLIIDDNRAIHDDFRKILSPDTASGLAIDASESKIFGSPGTANSQGQFQLDSAYQGQEGVLMVKAAVESGRPYAMAFVDVRMPPGMDGVETTQQIWAVDSEIQIVLCTAFSDASWDEMLEKVGDNDRMVILKKPFDAVEAFQLANALTAKWALSRQARLKMEELEAMVAARTRELRESNDTLQMQARVIESMSEAVIVADETGLIVITNPVCDRMFGYGRGELLGQHVAVLRDMELAEAQLATSEMMASLRRGESWSGEIIRRKQDGTSFITRANINAFEMGGRRHFFAVQEDITERKRVEAELGWKTAFLEAEIKSSPDGILVVDSHGKKILQNQRMIDLWNIPRHIADEVGDENRLKWVTDMVKNPEPFSAKVAHLYAHPDEVSEDEIELKNGTVLERYSSAVRGEDGIYYGRIWTFRDITPRRRIEAQLLQSQKMETVGKLAGGVAHEFNSIMTAIIGQSELLLNDLAADNPLAKNATEIRKAADRAAGLTRQLLAFGRKQILQPEILDLNAILTGMEIMLRHTVGSNVEVRIIPAAGLQLVKADASQIEQVIINMAINAAEAMPHGGKLTLETARLDAVKAGEFPELKAGGHVVLVITDTGVGMSDEVKARVFEPFFTTKGVGKGTGLGLATAHGIIKQSGGHIAVHSGPGRGTSFKIYLPEIQPAAAVPVQTLNAPNLPHGIETILLVEDDSALREMAASMLRRLGYKVLAATDGVEALNLIHLPDRGNIDLLFTDIVMPHMSGKELAGRIRALLPETKILFTSAYPENAIIHRDVRDEGVTLLQKPFTPSALAQKVREILDAK